MAPVVPSTTNALTREQYARASLTASRDGWKPAMRAARNSPVEQPRQLGRIGLRYRADEWTDRGVVAQLGEHLHGMQGVGGSSPPSSTTFREREGWRSSSGGTAKRPFVLADGGARCLFGAVAQ